ncbi:MULTISPECIES: ACP phosphodiesterase [unclassified Vibrio]|uniref:ACP phosphodiesterase n=1 Tax=Vibrio sp. HB236076 TaxID=3232307 RepID=A0AB39HHI2_9VIBR|nr:ACP phosphodiesterase [Vibrio sp. HB161653]MDP5252898.1 ACP phosphodiesterase [Vibrio sp. HB161653]
MNYLAHLDIAHYCQSDKLGNLLGDFVKGHPDSLRLPTVVKQGVLLHRFVDRYTDQHSQVLALKTLFPSSLRRYAPIALDVYWDHCLAQSWSQRYPYSLEAFSQQAKQEIEHSWYADVPSSFSQVHHKMWSQQWLLQYRDPDSVDRALLSIVRRRPRLAPLAETSEILSAHQQHLEHVFNDFYPQVLAASSQYFTQSIKQ